MKQRFAAWNQAFWRRCAALLDRFHRPLFLLAIAGLGLWARFGLLPQISLDMTLHLEGWVDAIRGYGGLPALKQNIGDYTPPYLLLLALGSYLPLRAQLLVKGISLLGDFLLCFAVHRLAGRLTQSPQKADLAAAVCFILPTVVLNSAAWGQCDAIYTAFLLLFVHHLLGGKPVWAGLCLGAAFAFKLQTVFLLPVAVLALVLGFWKLRHALCAAATYLVLFLPAILAGRGAAVLWTVYAGQSESYGTRLEWNLPNIYTWLQPDSFATMEEYVTPYLMLGLACLGILSYALWLRRADFDRATLFYAAAFFAILVPNVLPKMHDRYYFPADILLLLLAFARPKGLWCAVVCQLLSLEVYCLFLFERGSTLHPRVLALFSVAVVFGAGRALWQQLDKARAACPAGAAKAPAAPHTNHVTAGQPGGKA